MKRLFTWLELLKDLVFGYIKGHFFLFSFGLALGIAVVIFLPKILPIVPVINSRTQIVGISGNYTLSNLPLFIQEKISFGLTKVASDGSTLPGLSDYFEATDAGKTLVFHINRGLLWQDENVVSTKDLNYRLKGVEIQKDADEVRFLLKEPFAPLPSILSQPLFKNGLVHEISFFPKTINNLFFGSNLVGLGEYRATQTKFKGRFLSSLEIDKLSDNSKIVYKFYTSNETAITALKMGQVNEIDGLFKADVFDPKFYQVNFRYLPNTQAILFFNNSESLFADKKLRQALTFALPDNFSQGLTSENPLGMNNWARSGSNKKYPYSPEEAKTLIAPFASESGKLQIEILTNPLLSETATVIAKSWEQLGIVTKITNTDILPSRYQVYLNLVELPADPDQYFLWHSTQRTNIANYHSPKVDRLLEDGRKSYDLKTRMQNYSDFQKAITEDDPAAFLFYPKVYDVVRKF